MDYDTWKETDYHYYHEDDEKDEGDFDEDELEEAKKRLGVSKG
jgi:hypothetical protein